MDGGTAIVLGVLLLCAVIFAGPMRNGNYYSRADYGQGQVMTSDP